jgi:hypothetical protein
MSACIMMVLYNLKRGKKNSDMWATTAILPRKCDKRLREGMNVADAVKNAVSSDYPKSQRGDNSVKTQKPDVCGIFHRETKSEPPKQRHYSPPRNFRRGHVTFFHDEID